MSARRFIIVAMVGVCLSASAHAEELLSGSVRLACEAILCLSSGTRPAECAPSLAKYFSITDDIFSVEIEKRFNFLSLCPTDSFEGRSDLLHALAAGSGRCDTESLIRLLNPAPNCGKGPFFGGIRPNCTAADALPSYCAGYFGNQYIVDVNAPVKKQYCGNVQTFLSLPGAAGSPRTVHVCVARWIDPTQPPSDAQIREWLNASVNGNRGVRPTGLGGFNQ